MRRLDGLPLAVELAAARMRMLSVEQVLTGLDDVFRLLSGGPRTGPARHQSLRATLDWDHGLLSEGERVLFRRLGVFPGSFDLAAAVAVAGPRELGGGPVGAELVDLLAGLVDQSLVTVRRVAGQVRYRLLAPVRSYAREHLVIAGEQATVAGAHLDHYAALVEHSQPLLAGPEQAAELDHLEVEGNNLRAAVAFSASRRPPPLAGLTLAASLTRLCALRGHYREGRHWLDWAATVPMDAPAALRAKALLGSGSLAHLQCDYPAAVHRLEAARASYDQLGDRSGMAAALQALGSVAREQGRYSRAEALHRQALGLAEQDGDQLLIAQSHGYLGFCAWLQANWGGAEEACGQALQLFRALDDGEGIVWSLLSLGVTAQYQGQFASAGQLLGQAHELSVALTYREGTAWTAHELGLLALRRDPATAEPWLRAGLTGHRSLGDRWRTASVLVDLAAWTQQAGDDSGAVALLGAAAGIRAAIGTRPAPCERPDQERVESAARARLSAADFARAWAHGQSATVEDLLPPPRPPVRKQARHARSPAGTHADAPHVPEQAGRLRIGALGQASVHCGERMLTPADWGYAKPRELLFYLIASPPRTKDQIGQALWPDLEGPQLRNAFHTALRDLRRALGDPGWVTFTAGRYTMDRSRDHWCDLDIFEEALTAAAHARPAAAALPHLQRAISTYRGDFAADLPDADWLQPRRTELAHAYARALAAAGRLLDGAGRPREAIEVYTRAAEHDPLDELAHRNLIAALIRSGQAGQAARVYHQLTERLRSELGIAPAAQTRELYQRLTQTDARRE